MELDLAGLLQGRVDVVRSALDETASRVLGLTVGVVTAVGTGTNTGSVKLRLSMLSEEVETDWASVVTPWAGRTGERARGTWFPPAVDDQALVAFRQGDPRRAYVLGFLWSQQASPPEASPDRHGVWSARGSTVVLDDTPGAVAVRITSAAGHRVELDDAAHTVTVSAATGQEGTAAVVTVGRGGITVEARGGDLTLKGDTVTLEGKRVRITSSADTTIGATGALTVTGTPVRLN